MKSADCMENSIDCFHLNQTKLCFREQRCESEFFCMKLCHSSLETPLSLQYTAATHLLNIMVDLGLFWRHFGLWVAWRTHVWLARDSHHQVWMFLCLWLVCVMWFQVCKSDSCRVCVYIFVWVKNLVRVFIQKCNLGVWFVKILNIVKIGLRLSW